MRHLLAALIAAAFLVAATSADAAPSQRRVDSDEAAKALFLAQPNVERWLERYDPDALVTIATFDERKKRWKVAVLTGRAGQIAQGEITRAGEVVTAWVGPQVAWPLARGEGEGVGGAINRPIIWLPFCALFFFGLADLLRPVSMRNLDLLAALSLSVGVAFLNEGRVFASVLASVASLLYLLGRSTWIALTQRVARPTFELPVSVLLAALVVLVGFRVGLNTETSHTLDVGYAGVIGAHRLADGITPYGNFPRKDTGRPCGEADENGGIADWVQENGRCETANHLGDTYGPVNYHAYLPGFWILGWSGKWDSLPAVHFTTILFDLLAMLGLAAIGYRYGGSRLATVLAFAWAAYPFTQYVSSANSNDAIMPAFLIWGFWAATSDAGRGALAALASWTKLAALIVVPLWLTYPELHWRRNAVFAVAFGAASLLAFWVVLVQANPWHELGVFYERTFEIQADRSSPFSLWDWGDYHAAGLPDLESGQRALQLLLVVAAVAVAVYPRRKTPLQLAALTGALLVAFELALTHWFAGYIVWFFPFVLLATVAGYALTRTPPGARDPAADPAIVN